VRHKRTRPAKYSRKNALAQYRRKEQGNHTKLHDPAVTGEAQQDKAAKQPNHTPVSTAADKAHHLANCGIVGEAEGKIKDFTVKPF
jgi:hypothetical protein